MTDSAPHPAAGLVGIHHLTLVGDPEDAVVPVYIDRTSWHHLHLHRVASVPTDLPDDKRVTDIALLDTMSDNRVNHIKRARRPFLKLPTIPADFCLPNVVPDHFEHLLVSDVTPFLEQSLLDLTLLLGGKIDGLASGGWLVLCKHAPDQPADHCEES